MAIYNQDETFSSEVQNSLWQTINPATEEKQDDIITELWIIDTTLNTIDFATEAKQDDIIQAVWDVMTNQTDWSQKTWLVNQALTVINPATEEKQDDIITWIWAEGSTPPSISWTGILWYLRTLFDKVASFVWYDSHTTNYFVRTQTPVHICAWNSSTTPLWAWAEFTWTWHDINWYAEILITVRSDQNSATDWLIIEHSIDWIDVDDTDKFSIIWWWTWSWTSYRIVPWARYIRVRYVNWAIPQTVFRLSTTFRWTMTAWSTHRVDETLKDNSDWPLSINVIKLKKANNDYVSWAATNSWNFKVSLEEIEAWVDIASETTLASIDWKLDTIISTQTDWTQISKPYLADEFWDQTQMLSDNYFDWSPIVIDTEHHEIHCWDALTVSHSVDLWNWATRNILIVTPTPSPSTKRYHFYIEIETESETDYSLFEWTTVSWNWTAISAYNRNREDPVVSETEVLFYHTPTITTDWTLIENLHWWSGKWVWWTARWQNEWVFKNNEKYMIRVTNATANNNYISIKINYYVHPWV